MATTALSGDKQVNSPSRGGASHMISEMDAKLNSGSAMKPFDKEKILESDMYVISTATLKDERLDNNVLYTNLLARLESFYLVAEKYSL